MTSQYAAVVYKLFRDSLQSGVKWGLPLTDAVTDEAAQPNLGSSESRKHNNFPVQKRLILF